MTDPSTLPHPPHPLHCIAGRKAAVASAPTIRTGETHLSEQEKLTCVVFCVLRFSFASTVLAIPSSVLLAHEAPVAAHKLPLVIGEVTSRYDGPKGHHQARPYPEPGYAGNDHGIPRCRPDHARGVKAGDKIRFMAEKINGQVSVVKLEKTR